MEGAEGNKPRYKPKPKLARIEMVEKEMKKIKIHKVDARDRILWRGLLSVLRS
jgi:hypothetical protein